MTDSTYRAMLNRVNVVLNPIVNPDGVSLAYARQLVNPDHMLHAGRPGALGSDATSGGSSDDPIYPEAKARQMILPLSRCLTRSRPNRPRMILPPHCNRPDRPRKRRFPMRRRRPLPRHPSRYLSAHRL